MNYVTMQLGNLPLKIHMSSEATIAFEPLQRFNTIVDNPCDGVQAIISMQDIYVGADTVVEYGMFYPYKEMPELLAWVQGFELIEPNLRGF